MFNNYEFSHYWFQDQRPIVEKFIPLPGKDAPAYHILEIGAYEGAGTVFYADNYLEGKYSSITSIDPFDCSDSTSPVSGTTYERFMKNIFISKHFGKIKLIRDYSSNVLPRLIVEKKRYDYISIDGSHLPKDILLDGILAMKLIKPGGYIFFDDYMGDRGSLKSIFDTIIDSFGDELDIIYKGYHLIVRKK